MKCPNCKDQSLSISDRAGIEIDYCPECRRVSYFYATGLKVLAELLPYLQAEKPMADTDIYQSRSFY